MGVLKLIDTMHSLDPFLFKFKAEQRDADENIHEAYFAISPREWEKIRGPIRDKISRLVEKALGDLGDEGDGLAREQYVERFLLKIWEAKDIEGIEPFIKAMQIEPAGAPEIFFAWKAVCYYQVRFNDALEQLQTMFQWVGHNRLCYPADFVSMSKDELISIEDRRNLLRQKMREG